MYMFTCMNPIHMYRNKYEYVFVKQSCCYEKKMPGHSRRKATLVVIVPTVKINIVGN